MTIILTTKGNAEVKVSGDGLLVSVNNGAIVRHDITIFRGVTRVSRVVIIYHRYSIRVFSGLLPRRGVAFIVNNRAERRDMGGTIRAVSSYSCVVVRSNTHPLIAPRAIIGALSRTRVHGTTTANIFIGSAIGIISRDLGVINAPGEGGLILVRAPRVFRFGACGGTLRTTRGSNGSCASSYRLIRRVNIRYNIIVNRCRGVGVAAGNSIPVTRDVLGTETKGRL